MCSALEVCPFHSDKNLYCCEMVQCHNFWLCMWIAMNTLKQYTQANNNVIVCKMQEVLPYPFWGFTREWEQNSCLALSSCLTANHSGSQTADEAVTAAVNIIKWRRVQPWGWSNANAFRDHQGQAPHSPGTAAVALFLNEKSHQY